MTSEAQLAANRSNAKKSTGPRTPAGKAVLARNGIKHGLLSRECLVKGESEADLVSFGKRLRAQLAPVGELELLLADRIISTAWRLRRLVCIERIIFNTEGPTLAHAPCACWGRKNSPETLSRCCALPTSWQYRECLVVQSDGNCRPSALAVRQSSDFTLSQAAKGSGLVALPIAPNAR